MADLKITRQEIISLCRLCLAKDLASIDIFETGSEVRQLFTKIVACLPIQVSTGDSLPHKICEVCNSKVDDFYQFWTSTAKNQKQLNEWLQISTDEDQKTIVPTIKEEEVEADDTRQDEDYDDYDDGGRGDDSDDDEDAPSAAKRIKTQDSGDEDQKPTDLDAILENSTDVNGQKDGSGSSKKKSKEKQSEKSYGKVTKTPKRQKNKTAHPKNDSNVKYDCSQCGKIYNSKRGLRKHMITHQDKNNPSPVSPINSRVVQILKQWNKIIVPKSKECPICQKTYSSPLRMRRHIAEVHTKEKISCDVCQKQFSSNTRLTQHKKNVHLGGYKDKVKILNIECHHCGVKFKCKNEVIDHLNAHHSGVKAHVCHICKNVYSAKKGLKRHMKRHLLMAGDLPSEDMHQCDICSKVFLEHHALVKHRGWVHGDKCHVCKVCGVKIKGSIQKHMLSHTGEKPYCCHICGKSMQGKLKEHMLTHTGERPHACDICGSTFKDKWYLGVHMRKHNGEKPYKCNFCGEHFAAPSAFSNHLKKHVGQKVSLKSLVCQFCNLSFGSEEELTSHYPEHFPLSSKS